MLWRESVYMWSEVEAEDGLHIEGITMRLEYKILSIIHEYQEVAKLGQIGYHSVPG